MTASPRVTRVESVPLFHSVLWLQSLAVNRRRRGCCCRRRTGIPRMTAEEVISWSRITFTKDTDRLQFLFFPANDSLIRSAYHRMECFVHRSSLGVFVCFPFVLVHCLSKEALLELQGMRTRNLFPATAFKWQ